MVFLFSIKFANTINVKTIFDIVLASAFTKHRGVAQLVERRSPKP